MIDKVQAIMQEARRRNLDFAHLNDRQILFLLACEQDGSQIRVVGSRPNGEWVLKSTSRTLRTAFTKFIDGQYISKRPSVQIMAEIFLVKEENSRPGRPRNSDVSAGVHRGKTS